MNLSLYYNSPFLVRYFLINLYGYYIKKQRFNREFYRQFSLLLDNLQKDEATIEYERISFLKQNLINAEKNIPYYKRIFKEVGFEANEFRYYDDLKCIPILDKQTIRDNFSELINPHYPKKLIVRHETSGSTGEKLLFYHPKYLTYAIEGAFMYRFYHMNGINPFDKRVTLGARRFTNREPYHIINHAENQLLLSIHHLNQNTAENYLKKIIQFKPKFMQGHPSGFLLLSKFVIENSIKISVPIKNIFTTGETLSEDERQLIERAFNTILLQSYGSGESCFSAQETIEKNGYMINYEHGHIELEGNGEYKEIIATSYLNPVMPFIRYKVGDLVQPLPDKKSINNFPSLFDKVIGRIDDVISDNFGNSIMPVRLRMLVKPHLRAYTNYQLIYYKDERYYELVLIDPKRILNTNIIIRSLKSILGSDANIKITFTDNLISDGGKIRNIILSPSGLVK